VLPGRSRRPGRLEQRKLPNWLDRRLPYLRVSPVIPLLRRIYSTRLAWSLYRVRVGISVELKVLETFLPALGEKLE
jgi:hypothetical protein